MKSCHGPAHLRMTLNNVTTPADAGRRYWKTGNRSGSDHYPYGYGTAFPAASTDCCGFEADMLRAAWQKNTISRSRTLTGLSFLIAYHNHSKYSRFARQAAGKHPKHQLSVNQTSPYLQRIQPAIAVTHKQKRDIAGNEWNVRRRPRIFRSRILSRSRPNASAVRAGTAMLFFIFRNIQSCGESEGMSSDKYWVPT